MIKVLLKNSQEMRPYSFSELEKVMGIRWIEDLEFQTHSIEEKVVKHSSKSHRRKELSIQEKWIGVHFQKEILGGYMPDVSIRFIGEDVGYGVFTEKEIPLGAYIGEYTGLIRKRTPRRDRKNHYCFTYSIGDWKRNPFIIDAKMQGNFTRFINHNEDPNLETLSVFAGGVMHIVLLAIRPIMKGEQLTYHYGDAYWKRRPKAKDFMS